MDLSFNKLYKVFYRLTICFSALLFQLNPTPGFSAEKYVSLKIEPEHVGAFYVNKTQQFTAYGLTASGARVNLTTQVDWFVEEYPFAGQDMKAVTLVSINENGLAKMLNSWGRVKISACYPKGCGPKEQSVRPGWVAVVNMLLKEKDQKKYFPWINFLLLKDEKKK